MDDDTWAGYTIRLAIILQAVLPTDASEYCRAVERAREAEKRMTDAGLDMSLTADPTLRLLVGRDLAEAIYNLPPDIKYADVRR